MVWVDGGVHNNPSPAPQLPVGWEVHKDRLFARHQRIYNHGPVLEDLTVHVCWKGEGRGGEGEGVRGRDREGGGGGGGRRGKEEESGGGK